MTDPRMTWTPGALSHDAGGRRYKDYGAEPLASPSVVYWSPVMREAALAIMASPVTVRQFEPAPTSGEIEVPPC